MGMKKRASSSARPECNARTGLCCVYIQVSVQGFTASPSLQLRSTASRKIREFGFVVTRSSGKALYCRFLREISLSQGRLLLKNRMKSHAMDRDARVELICLIRYLCTVLA